MHSYDYWLILAFLAVVLIPAPFLGRFFYKVMEGQRTWLTPDPRTGRARVLQSGRH